MKLLYTSEVKASEIDHLGHLNVRYYMERAQQANKALMDSLGLGPAACKALGARLTQADTYTRYHREQFQGSTLVVRGGVLAASAEGLSLYFEVDNDEKAQVAATFIIGVSLFDRATRKRIALPDDAVAKASAELLIEAPEHGRPRTVDLGAPRLDIRYEDLVRRLGDDHSDPMSRRMERVIEAADCDEFGFLADSQDMMFGTLRMPKVQARGAQEGETWGPMTFVSDEGHRFGWASMESRSVRVAQPRAGDKLCSIGAEIGLYGKVRHSRRWIFNITTGELVSLNDNVAIALDLDARRSIAIPTKVRSALERRHLPEFA
jgi:acyl-CoA thioester hydrolase